MYYIDENNFYRDELDHREVVVTIRCITYNHEKYIADALEGFVRQKTSFRFEAIIHDDASTDGTTDIIRKYAERYPSIIKPIFESENQYNKKDGSLRRIMNEHTRGKYIAFCEGDDYWIDPHKLQKQVEALDAHPECVIALHRVMKVNAQKENLNEVFPPIENFSDHIVTLDDVADAEFRMGLWMFQTSSYLFRYEMQQKYAELRQNVFKDYPYGDFPLLFTCLYYGNGFFIPECMSCYRVFSGPYSIVTSIAQSPKVAANTNLRIIEGLKRLNKFCNYEYNKEVKVAINRCEERVDFAINRFSYRWFMPRYYKYWHEVCYRFVLYECSWLLDIYRTIKKLLR